MAKIIQAKVTLDIYYYIPNTMLLNEFIWQLDDEVPEIPNTHRFLKFWKSNIDAVIKEILIAHSYQREWRKVDWTL